MDDAGLRATRLLENEARGLLTRLDQVKPFALHETMVPAAAPPYEALQRIERFLVDGRRELRARVREYLGWLRGPGRGVEPAEQQHRFVLIRMSFNDVLAQFDLFTEVVTQRSEHGTGVWLSGLDVLARDALAVDLPGRTDPPAVCYLARGPGAAIRRAASCWPAGSLRRARGPGSRRPAGRRGPAGRPPARLGPARPGPTARPRCRARCAG